MYNGNISPKSNFATSIIHQVTHIPRYFYFVQVGHFLLDTEYLMMPWLSLTKRVDTFLLLYRPTVTRARRYSVNGARTSNAIAFSRLFCFNFTAVAPDIVKFETSFCVIALVALESVRFLRKKSEEIDIFS